MSKTSNPESADTVVLEMCVNFVDNEVACVTVSSCFGRIVVEGCRLYYERHVLAVKEYAT